MFVTGGAGYPAPFINNVFIVNDSHSFPFFRHDHDYSQIE